MYTLFSHQIPPCHGADSISTRCGMSGPTRGTTHMRQRARADDRPGGGEATDGDTNNTRPHSVECLVTRYFFVF